MSTKSKRRSERRAMTNESASTGKTLSEREQTLAGQLMGAILSAFSFGALDTEQRRRRPAQAT